MFSIPVAPKRLAIVHVSRTTCWRNSAGRRTRPAAPPRAVERMMRRLREKVLVGTEAARGTLPRDQALARELRLGLLERGVGRGEDHVRAEEAVVRHWLALCADELEHPGEGVAESILIVRLARDDGRVVELV